MKKINWFLKPLLAIAVAFPLMSTVQVQSADAGHKYRRGAIIAGAIIGGAIAYHHHRKYRKHRYYGHRKHYYGGRYYGKRYYHGKHYSRGGRYYHPKLGRTIGIK